MRKMLFTAALVAALSACGGGGGEVEIEIEDVMEPCPAAGEILPEGMGACVSDPDKNEVQIVVELDYPDGCVVSRIGDPDTDAVYAVPGETLTAGNPCEEGGS